MGFPELTYNYNRNGFLTRIALIDGPIQKVVLTSLHARLLLHSHYPALAGHTGERGMYDMMRREYHWDHMANDQYKTERDGRECVWNKVSEKWRYPPQLFSGNSPLKFVALDIFRSLPKTSNGNQFVFDMTDG